MADDRIEFRGQPVDHRPGCGRGSEEAQPRALGEPFRAGLRHRRHIGQESAPPGGGEPQRADPARFHLRGAGGRAVEDEIDLPCEHVGEGGGRTLVGYVHQFQPRALREDHLPR